MMTITIEYVLGLILVLAAVVFLPSQPLLSALIAMCGVVTLGRLLWRLR